MRWAILILGFLLLAPAAHAADVCTLQPLLTLESPPDPDNHLLVPATIGDRQTHLMLDTGGAWSLLDRRFAESLGLPLLRMPLDVGTFRDSTGGTMREYVRVPSLKIGEWRLNRPVDFVVTAAAPGGGALGRYQGSLGLNMLAGFDVEIDNARRKVTLFEPTTVQDCGVHWADEAASFRFHMVDMTPIARAEVDGEEVDAVIDTGSSITTVNTDFVRRHFNITPTSPGVRKLGSYFTIGGNNAEVYETTIKTLSVSGVLFENVPVHLVDMKGTKLILGMHELRHLHLYFAFKTKTIFVTTADATHAPAATPR